jgi:hypothetical protein
MSCVIAALAWKLPLPERPEVGVTWPRGLAAESAATTKPKSTAATKPVRSLLAGPRPKAATVTLQALCALCLVLGVV